MVLGDPLQADRCVDNHLQPCPAGTQEAGDGVGSRFDQRPEADDIGCRQPVEVQYQQGVIAGQAFLEAFAVVEGGNGEGRQPFFDPLGRRLVAIGKTSPEFADIGGVAARLDFG